jgi:hypothetical protein
MHRIGIVISIALSIPYINHILTTMNKYTKVQQ